MKIFITGGSSGFGKYLAEELVKDSHEIYVSFSFERHPHLVEFFQNIGIIPIDMYFEENREYCKDLDNFLQNYDFDVLILNAGKMAVGGLLGFDIQQMRHIFESNILGNLAILQQIHKKRKNAMSKLKVIFISSVASMVELKGLYLYSASKNGLNTIIEGLKNENPDVMDIYTIYPGPFDTNLHRNIIHSSIKAATDKLPYNKDVTKMLYAVNQILYGITSQKDIVLDGTIFLEISIKYLAFKKKCQYLFSKILKKGN